MAQELPAKTTSQADPSPGRRVRRRSAIAAALAAGLFGGLFVINGVCLCLGETPVLHVLSERPKDSFEDRSPPTVKVFAFNIAKCFVFKDGEGLESVGTVKGRLERIADLIRAEDPDFVFLSETIIVQWSLHFDGNDDRPLRRDQAISAGVMRNSCFFPFRTTVTGVATPTRRSVSCA